MESKKLREQRYKLNEDAHAILDRAEKEERRLTVEEKTEFDRLHEEMRELKEDIERHEKDERSSAEMTAIQEPIAARKDGPVEGAGKPEEEEKRAAFESFLRGGIKLMTSDEIRALQADSDTLGGYTITPEKFVTDLIKQVDDTVFVRQFATKHQVPDAASLGAAALSADPADADWTAEITAVSEDTTMAFGKRDLHPHLLSKLVKVSQKMLRLSTMGPEALVRNRLAYKFGITEEKGFLTGHGAGQPLGVFTASAQGISTSRDVSSGNTTTSIQFDGLYSAKYALKQQYRRTGIWSFHRDGMAQIAKLKDGNGQYIWTQSVRVGEPDRIMNIPVYESEYVPNTFTTGLYVGILGDFSFYWIADALNMTVQRLDELYAATNQVGFIGRAELDGMPVLEEAFARVKLA